jgi:phage shock protein A
MTILTRITRLFKADIHGILDSLEEPESILKQAIRDMQDEIDKATAAISAFSQQQERLLQKQQTLSERIKDLQQQLRFCFSENNESLAKSVIRKKLQAECSQNEISRQLANLSEEKDRLIAETGERKEKLQSICDKLVLFTEQNPFNEPATATEANTSIHQDDIELAFLYEKQRYAEDASNGESS